MAGQHTAKATFRMLSWEEKPLGEEQEGGTRIVHASTTQRFEGDVDGDVRAEYLMVRPDDTFADIAGMLTVTGTLGGRRGGFALRTNGTFDKGTLQAELWVVPGSGTGELAGISGGGNYLSQEEAAGTVSLSYRFD
ncbi:hypothetical protein RKD29_006578 [Streptomyces tendae]|uniref:DUF3224 domain-containing protein n=1 Tax=Streptomyces tendae TaxID=1932 RepID=UPI0038376936